MGAARTSTRRRILTPLGILLATVLIVGMSATIASAAPAEPTMSLGELQSLLDLNGGTVDGTFKTVVKGEDIATLGLTITAITSDDWGASNASRALIMFESDDPLIQKYGGIVAGMSGSPVYVYDPFDDRTEVVGAVSYGNWFDISGTGLATPIDAMIALEDFDSDLPIIASLADPVAVEGEVVSQVVVTGDEATAKAFADDKGTLVVKPYATVSVGGLPPTSRGYKAFAKLAERHGYDLTPLVGPLGPAGDFSAPLEPGAAVAALYSTGDFWAGGIGTVTYPSEERVLAFGHPMDWEGKHDLLMANAWIDGVWPSAETPFKVGRPGETQGRIVQDRGSGILGRTDADSAQTEINVHVVDASTGHEADGTSYMPASLLNNWFYTSLTPMAVYSTTLRGVDDYWYQGSADVTTTIVVSDGVEEYEVVRANKYFSDFDVAFEAPMDPWMLVDVFAAASTNGYAHPVIKSITFEGTFSPENNTATIVDVRAPHGLKTGVNAIEVDIVPHGDATQTINAEITLPVGTPLTGELEVSGAWGGMAFANMYDSEGEEVPNSYASSVDRSTVADVVEDMNDWATNSDLIITFVPFDEMTAKDYDFVQATKSTDFYVIGGAMKEATKMVAKASPTTVSYNGSTTLIGDVEGLWDNCDVKIYRTYAGGAEQLVATVPAETSEWDPYPVFFSQVTKLTKNATLRVVYEGDDEFLASEKLISIKVKASVGLTTSASAVSYGKLVTLTSVVAPSGSVGTVKFQYSTNGGTWKTISTKTLASSKASVSFKFPKGSNKVRATYTPGLGATNIANTSALKTVTVK